MRADVLATLERLLWPLRRRVLLMVTRAVVRLVDDAGGRQTLQLEALAGEALDGAERFQTYGLTSSPPVGSEAVLLALGGARQHPVAVAVEDRTVRPRDAAPGTVVLYTALDADEGAAHRLTLAGNARRLVAECRDPGGAGGATATIEPGRIVLACGRSSITLTDAAIEIAAPALRGRDTG